MTNESNLLWILLSGRVRGRSAAVDSFPHLEGELSLVIDPDQIVTVKPDCAARYLEEPANIVRPAPTWGLGESCFPDAPEDTARFPS